MRKAYLHHAFELALFIFKRDWIRLLIWIFAITALSVVVAGTYESMYAEQAGRDAMAEVMKNPAMTAMFGVGYGLENYTTGAIMAHTMLLMTGALVAVMVIMQVTRHTRTDEEEGRLEMVRSLPVGRNATLVAIGIIMTSVLLIMALMHGFLLSILGIESLSFGDSLLYGFALAMIGFVFLGLTLVLAQLFTSSRTVLSMGFLFLGFFYLIRSVGDLSWGALSWISPFHWMLYTKVYVENLLWPLGLLLTGFVFLTGVAMHLGATKDLDGGFFKQKAGKDVFPKRIKTPFTFALRIERTMLIGWFITIFVLGSSYGSVFGDIEAYVNDNDIFKQLLPPIEGVTLTEQFVSMVTIVMVMTSTIPSLMGINRLALEERKNQTDIFIGHPLKRRTLMLGYLVISLTTAIIALFISAYGMYVAASATVDVPIRFGVFLSASMTYLPALFVMIGVAAVLVGMFPNKTFLSWFYLGYAFVVIYLGQLLDFPEFLSKLTPFGYIPKLPVEDVYAFPLVFLIVMALALMVLGIFGYQKRDILG